MPLWITRGSNHAGGMRRIDSHAYRWSPPVGLLSLGWTLTGAAVVWWWTATTPADKLFIGVVALVLFCVCAASVFVRPRLRADENGVTVRGVRGKQQWSWSEMAWRTTTSHRLGRIATVLELDVPQDRRNPAGLFVLTKLDLSEDPEDVATTLDSLYRR